jgi:hypothetical protein
MVLTGEVGAEHSRRRILAGFTGSSVLGALAACGESRPAPVPAPTGPDPLQPLLDEAVALAAAYTRVTVSQPALAGRLAPLAADHRAHVDELTRVIGAAPSAGAAADAAGPGASALGDLREAELAAQRSAATLCADVAADRAALAGSIAACRATHVEALR